MFLLRQADAHRHDHERTPADEPDERAFFQTVGTRIAQARKDADLTQVQLADALAIPQPQLASYEVGRRRVPVSMLPRLARALDAPSYAGNWVTG